MKTLIDMHTHTGFSPDGEGTVEQSLAKAKELGLAAFAIAIAIFATKPTIMVILKP